MVSALNIKGSRVDDNDHHYISSEMYERWMTVPLEAEDVLLTSEAPTGEVAYLPERQDWAIGQRLFGLRGKPGVLHGRYLFYALCGGDARHQMMSRATGTTVSGIRQSELVKVELDLPPIEEQRAIAATLGALDDKIESNRRVGYQSLELLGAMAEAHCSPLPTTSLGSLTGLTRTTVSPAALGDAVVDHYSLPAFDTSGRPERVPASMIMSNKIGLIGSSVLVSRLNPRTNRTWWAAQTGSTPALASTEFAVLTAQTEVELGAIWLAVRHSSFLEELPRRVTGTSGSHQRVRPDDMLAIHVPDVRRLDDATKETALSLLRLAHQRREESARLSDLRAALLPELLSGRIRVPEVADVVQDVVDESESA